MLTMPQQRERQPKDHDIDQGRNNDGLWKIRRRRASLPWSMLSSSAHCLA